MPPRPSRFRAVRMPLFVASLLLLAGVGAAAVLGVRAMTRSSFWVEHTYAVIASVAEAESAMRLTETNARGYRLTGHPVMRAEYLAALPRAEEAMDALVSGTADDPAQQARARGARAAASSHLAELQRLMDVQDAQGKEAAQAAMRTEHSIKRTRNFNALTGEMRDHEVSLLSQRRDASGASVQRLLAFVVLGIALSLSLLLALAANLASENRRSRRLEQEARDAITGLRAASALGERLSEQRHALSVYAGLLQSCQSLDEAMELTSATLQQLVPGTGGRCYVQRPSGNLFEAAADFGEAEVASSDFLRNDECWALRRGQPHHVDGHSTSMRCQHVEAGVSLAGIATLCVPLMAQGVSLGLLHASGPADGGPGDNDALLIESVAEQLGMAIANLQLRETLRLQSLRDPLTGLFNRRYLEENLQRELVRCERKGLPLSLLMIDVDHFKQFNDQHGHAAGDAVLAHVGRAMQSVVRNEDLACRYGGEEFTVVLPEVDAAVAIERAEAIRAAISASTVQHLRKTVGPVTASIGVASFPPDGSTPQVLFEFADAALYRAKAEGRNRVVHAAAST